RALRAIGIIPHTKVLVNLKQTLLVPDSFQELLPAWIGSKETRRSRFEAAVRQLRRELLIFRPHIFPERSGRIEIVRQPKWKQYISQNVGRARFADQGHFLLGHFGSERVMKIPKRMIQRFKKMFYCGDTALTQSTLKTRPLARQDRQRGQPSLRMIQWPCAAEAPNFGRQN